MHRLNPDLAKGAANAVVTSDMHGKDHEPLKDGLGRPSAQSAIGLGYQLMAAVLFFVGGGYYLDSRHGGEGHVFTLLGMALAFIYGGYEVWKLVRLMEKEEQQSTRDKQNISSHGTENSNQNPPAQSPRA